LQALSIFIISPFQIDCYKKNKAHSEKTRSRAHRCEWDSPQRVGAISVAENSHLLLDFSQIRENRKSTGFLRKIVGLELEIYAETLVIGTPVSPKN
jgi:hypothetical protein